MPRDINGVYTPPAGTIVASGDTILPSQHNPSVNDVASALTYSLSRQGQGSMLADLSLGGFKVKDIAAATLAGDAPRFDQVVPATGGAFTGNVSFSARVSIGTALFSTQLAVSADSTVQNHLSLIDTAVGGKSWGLGPSVGSGAAGTVALYNYTNSQAAFTYTHGGAWSFYTAGIPRLNIGSTGAVSVTGTLAVSGATTLSGGLDLVSSPLTWSGLANFSMGIVGGNARLTGDANDYYEYDRTNNRHSFHIGGFQRFYIDANYAVLGGNELGNKDALPFGVAGSFNLQSSYRGRTVVVSAGGTVTIVTNATLPIESGANIDIINEGPGAIVISPAGGVTLNWAATGGTGNRNLAAKGWATVRKTSTDIWYIRGEGIS